MEPSICHISIFIKLDGDFRVPFYSRHWVYHNPLRHCFVPLTVKDSDWSQTASTKAPRSEQRKFPVFRGFPWFDPICALNGFQNLRRALDIASSSKANNANVLTLRLEGEEVVEGHDPVNLAQWDTQRLGDKPHRIFVNVAESLLNRVESFNKGMRLVAMPSHRRFNYPPSFVIGWRRNPWSLQSCCCHWHGFFPSFRFLRFYLKASRAIRSHGNERS
jgi:hypothetical protein